MFSDLPCADNNFSTEELRMIRNESLKAFLLPKRKKVTVLLCAPWYNIPSITSAILAGNPYAEIIDMNNIKKLTTKVDLIYAFGRLCPLQEYMGDDCTIVSSCLNIEDCEHEKCYGYSIKSSYTCGLYRITRYQKDIERKCPVLTIITRAYKRPRQLHCNIFSVKGQAIQRYQHIVIPDDDGVGLYEANKSFMQVLDDIEGNYVMILDDDDILISDNVVGEVMHIDTFKKSPDMIVWKVWRLTEIVPTPVNWEYNKYRNSHRVANCYAVKNSFFKRTIESFGTPVAGDQHWQQKMFSIPHSIFWYNGIMSANLRIGNCKPEGK